MDTSISWRPSILKCSKWARAPEDISTGRYDVTALELVADNLAVLWRNAVGLENVASYHGGALDWGIVVNNEFDADYAQSLLSRFSVTTSGGGR